MARRRPNPATWAWYALGGRLPERNREWVLHDITARTWVLRHFARTTVLIAPLVLVWLFVPAPLGLRLALVALGCIVGYFYSLAYMEEGCEHRLVKHGYEFGTGRRIRAEASQQKTAEARARYEARYRS